MKQEDKDLLLKDLCARLPYKTKCSYYDICLLAHCNGEIYGIENKEYAVVDGKCVAFKFIKPYLFHLSSMTDKQQHEFLSTCNGYCDCYWTDETFDWLNENHFDYRGLIEKGLAIDATGLNIY